MKSEEKRKASVFWAVSMMTMTLTCNFMAVLCGTLVDWVSTLLSFT